MQIGPVSWHIIVHVMKTSTTWLQRQQDQTHVCVTQNLWLLGVCAVCGSKSLTWMMMLWLRWQRCTSNNFFVTKSSVVLDRRVLCAQAPCQNYLSRRFSTPCRIGLPWSNNHRARNECDHHNVLHVSVARTESQTLIVLWVCGNHLETMKGQT